MTKKIKISSIEELMEISTVSGGAVEVATHKEKQTEALLRSYIRSKIATLHEQSHKKEQQLRTVIRRLIKEAKDVSNPHPNTGINKLRDAFRKAKPTIKSQFQQLTTSSDQRDSFIAHLLAAFVRLFQQLDALNATSDSTTAADATAKVVGGFDLEEPNQDAIDDIEKDLESLLEQVGIAISDDKDIVSDDEENEKPKTQTEKDVQKKKDQDTEREEFAGGMEGEITGRNQAFDAFRLTQSYFSDAYLDLADPTDKQMFKDWCLYNLDLLLKSFEQEIQPDIERPDVPTPEGG
tara:strand:- start:653 stop:1531 length:879 start_codon:yes stop_codon:yes gene_type:complete